MGRAAVVVDVYAVRLIEANFGLALDQSHQTFYRRRGRTVRAVDSNSQTGQVAGNRFRKVVGIFNDRVDLALEYTADPVMGHARNGLKVIDQILDPCLGSIRQLVAVACKDLDAVVFERIVACRNDNTSICLVLDGEVRDSRRRDNAEQFYICADRANARYERILQHIRGNARILADQKLGLFAVRRLLCERICSGCTDLKCEQCIKLKICNAADAVRSKVSTQYETPIFPVDTTWGHAPVYSISCPSAGSMLRCRYACIVTHRPRGVRLRKPICMRYGS